MEKLHWPPVQNQDKAMLISSTKTLSMGTMKPNLIIVLLYIGRLVSLVQMNHFNPNSMRCLKLCEQVF